MTVLSLLRQTSVSSVFRKCCVPIKNIAQPIRLFTTSGVRKGGGHDRTMVILPSRWQWQKYKDGLHFYIMLGVLPLSALVFFTNVFIGPATLSEIPEGYRPHHWEYHRHPISRFFAKYLTVQPQQAYEANLHYLVEIEEQRLLRLLEWKILKLMEQRGDYQNYYATKISVGNYQRLRLEQETDMIENRGNE